VTFAYLVEGLHTAWIKIGNRRSLFFFPPPPPEITVNCVSSATAAADCRIGQTPQGTWGAVAL